jgi:hypothetical protein
VLVTAGAAVARAASPGAQPSVAEIALATISTSIITGARADGALLRLVGDRFAPTT